MSATQASTIETNKLFFTDFTGARVAFKDIVNALAEVVQEGPTKFIHLKAEFLPKPAQPPVSQQHIAHSRPQHLVHSRVPHPIAEEQGNFDEPPPLPAARPNRDMRTLPTLPVPNHLPLNTYNTQQLPTSGHFIASHHSINSSQINVPQQYGQLPPGGHGSWSPPALPPQPPPRRRSSASPNSLVTPLSGMAMYPSSPPGSLPSTPDARSDVKIRMDLNQLLKEVCVLS